MARPKGYADWKPQPHVEALIYQIQDILHQYREYLPMTARQVFYRLVGAYDYDKTEQAYSRLCEHLVRARRAQLISFKDIRDDGTVENLGPGWQSMTQMWEAVENTAENYTRDRMQGQLCAIELWCEAAGMAPMLANAMAEYSVDVYSTGGFSSVTVTHEVSERVRRRDRPTIFMHVGDFDPSGESIFNAMAEDIGAFVIGKTGDPDLFIPRRVALTLEQVEEHDLPTAPPKKSDTRSVNWYEQTCQLEAMPPDLLTKTVRDAVDAELDHDVRDALIETEGEEREVIERQVREAMAEVQEQAERKAEEDEEDAED